MHPYRDAPVPDTAPSRPLEELVLYIALVAFGVMAIAFALLRGAFGTDATLGAIVAIIGAWGLAGRG